MSTVFERVIADQQRIIDQLTEDLANLHRRYDQNNAEYAAFREETQRLLGAWWSSHGHPARQDAARHALLLWLIRTGWCLTCAAPDYECTCRDDY